MIRLRFSNLLPLTIVVAGCASGPAPPPYPAFVQSDDLTDIFMASLPGVRAKQFTGDPQTRASSNRIDLPPDWRGTTGGSPGKALEIFVLAGELRLADVALASGGYAFVPPGSLGFNLQTDGGARLLYFLDNVDTAAVIQTPLILDSGLVDWERTDRDGMTIKSLRDDPGSGAHTWLLRISPGARIPWESTSVPREGYLVDGEYRHSECVNGEAYTASYVSGGYFSRPAAVINGGPEAAALTESIWLLRETRESTTTTVDDCKPDTTASLPPAS